MLKQVQGSSDHKKLMLLDEQRFTRVATPVAFCTLKPCTVQDMQHIINPIIQRYYTHSTENLFYHIDSVTVNGEPADYYIGQTGDITCIIHIVALYRDDRYYIKSVFGNLSLIHI